MDQMLLILFAPWLLIHSTYILTSKTQTEHEGDNYLLQMERVSEWLENIKTFVHVGASHALVMEEPSRPLWSSPKQHTSSLFLAPHSPNSPNSA